VRTALILGLLAVAVPARAGLAPQALAGLGLQNVAADSTRVAFENRRWRHPMDALGHVARLGPLPSWVVFRRQGLDAAAVALTTERVPGALEVRDLGQGAALSSALLDTTGGVTRTAIAVRYPSDPDWPGAPPGRARPTWRSVDLAIGPSFSYELGRVFQPFLYRLDAQATLLWNPWPGGLARAGIIVHGHDDFDFDPEHPDRDKLRPEPLAFDQFAWVPGVALVSGSGGVFGDNRWGFSLGAARPLLGGRVLLDAQADETGFIAFVEGGLFSSPTRFSGFAGATWHVGQDVSVRVRAEKFVLGDRGVELAVDRAVRDMTVGVFAQRAGGERILGARVTLPVPPFTRPTGAALRVLPVENWSVDYHSRSDGTGVELSGVPSREDFLARLDPGALEANVRRFQKARGDRLEPLPATPPALVSFVGTTGFVNTPWAGVMTDQGAEAGYSHVPKRWAYDQRGVNDNEIAYVALGLLPRVEVDARITMFPGLKTFGSIVPESRLTDTDYMASGRVSLIDPQNGRPGLAAGVDDVQGTRRFHSSYLVSGLPVRILQVQGRFSLGYAFRIFKATRYTLDGVFGAAEISPLRYVAGQVEYDSEKWNVALAVPTPFGLRLRAALLNLRTPSVGVGWYVPLR
jgi:exopolysaccharide biosynthesis protein YbjH